MIFIIETKSFKLGTKLNRKKNFKRVNDAMRHLNEQFIIKHYISEQHITEQ